MKIGRHGTITAEQARKLAIATLGKTLKGDDPAEERVARRNALTVKELSERYLAAADKGLILGKGNRPKKASSLYVDRGSINRHILSLLGSKRVPDLKAADARTPATAAFTTTRSSVTPIHRYCGNLPKWQ